MLTLHSVLSLPIPVLCTVIRYLVVVHSRRNDYEKEKTTFESKFAITIVRSTEI